MELLFLFFCLSVSCSFLSLLSLSLSLSLLSPLSLSLSSLSVCVCVCVVFVCVCVWGGWGGWGGGSGGGGQIKTTTRSKQTNKIQGCCLHEHVVDVLLRTDNTQNHLTLVVRGTAQTAAHHAYIVEIKSIVIIDMSRVAFRVLVDTRVLSGVEAFICCNQDSRCTGSSSPKDRCGCRAP